MHALRKNITLSMADVSLFDVVEAVSKQKQAGLFLPTVPS